MANRRLLVVSAILATAISAVVVARQHVFRPEPDYPGFLRGGTEAWNNGRYADAEKLLGRCELGYPTALRRDDAAACLGLHGEVLTTLGRASEAERAFSRAQRLLEGVTPTPAILGRVLYGRAHLACISDRYTECEAIARDALSVLDSWPHATRGPALKELGNAQRSLGRLPEARETLKESIAAFRAAGDATNAAVAEVDLGALEQRLGHLNSAESTLNDAFAIFSGLKEGGHPYAGVALRELGRVQLAQGKLAEAEATLRRAIERLERDMGPNAPHLSNALLELGSLFESAHPPADAEMVLRRCVSISKANHNSRHTGWGASRLAWLLSRQGRYAEALTFADEAVGQMDPSDVDERAQALLIRGLLRQRANDWDDAERDLREAVALRESQTPREDPALKQAQQALSRVTAARRGAGSP